MPPTEGLRANIHSNAKQPNRKKKEILKRNGDFPSTLDLLSIPPHRQRSTQNNRFNLKEQRVATFGPGFKYVQMTGRTLHSIHDIDILPEP